MSALKLLGTAALVFGLGATPSAAQQVVSEPGYCAFFYAYANCQNKGPGNPYTDPNYPRGPAPYAHAGASVGAAPVHIRRHRAQ
jgi:hypothetical protein